MADAADLAACTFDFSKVQILDDDLPFERDIERNPYLLKCWLRYLDHKAEASLLMRAFIYERAVKQLPGSYKLWKSYLDIRTLALKGKNPVTYNDQFRRVNLCFERALILLHKLPRLWLDYTTFLMKQPCITRTRRTFDRALRALPITQHDRIWPLYLTFARRVSGETALKVYRRYIKLDANATEDYIDLLVDLHQYNEAAQLLVRIIEDDRFTSKRGKSRYRLWTDLCDLMCQYPRDIQSIRADVILKSGIRRFPDQAGRLWNALAQYWILLGQFETARDVFEEGIREVMTVRDFTQVFYAYAEFQESLITSKMQAASDREAQGQADPRADLKLDLQLLRFENLMDRRPFLVNDVLLRQNPHNVMEWENRVTLCQDRGMGKIIATYNDAVTTVHPKKATGPFHQLWIHFAQFYEESGQLDQAREVMERAVKVDYKHVNDLAEVWCAYAELELRHQAAARALLLLGRAVAPPTNARLINYHDETLPVQRRVFKSLKLWSFYVDLEESIGSLESTRAAYDRVLELKIATPQVVVNYTRYLQEQHYYEDSFRVYERGIELFGYPVAFELWNLYLKDFMQRYGGTKLERARDLFEQSLAHCPAEYAKPLYLLYGRLEEEHGSARQAMRVYDRATRAVADNDRLEMFRFYIAKTHGLFGVVATREIYERAIEALPDRCVPEMCIEYAEMELKLNEVDRARALYGYASQFCDPRTSPNFWKIWHEFEVKHGNEDTFKEMLRIKRSVQAKFNTDANFVAAQVQSAQQVQATNETTTPAAGEKTQNPNELDIDLDAEDSDDDVEVNADQRTTNSDTNMGDGVANDTTPAPSALGPTNNLSKFVSATTNFTQQS
ncbi:pre-mRNA-splicing factor syf1 [Dimargaris xerosporica]|nr:pre-mRNA-splicing factor syf1 [Dimargaris xerosporica]